MAEKFVVFIVETAWDPAVVTEAEWAEAMQQHQAFTDAVEAAGAQVLSGEALQPESAAVRIDPAVGDRPAVFTDGPFGDARGVVTGYYTISARDAAQARELAALAPTTGHIELYPILDL